MESITLTDKEVKLFFIAARYRKTEAEYQFPRSNCVSYVWYREIFPNLLSLHLCKCQYGHAVFRKSDDNCQKIKSMGLYILSSKVPSTFPFWPLHRAWRRKAWWSILWCLDNTFMLHRTIKTHIHGGKCTKILL